MTTGIETLIGETFLKVFGNGQVLGIVGILLTTILIVVMKPPEAVAITAVGLSVLFIISPFLGGLGLIPILFGGLALGLAILIYLAVKRGPTRDY